MVVVVAVEVVVGVVVAMYAVAAEETVVAAGVKCQHNYQEFRKPHLPKSPGEFQCLW